MTFRGYRTPGDSTTNWIYRDRPVFNLTGSVLQLADLTSGTESEKYAQVAAHQNITGANLVALDLYQRISRSLNHPNSPFSTLPINLSMTGISGSDNVIFRPGNVITLSVSKKGKDTNPLFNGGASPWLTGSMRRFTIGITSSFKESNVKISSAPAGYDTLSFSSNVGMPSWSEDSGSLRFLPQYNLEINNFGYAQQHIFTPFTDATSLLGFGGGGESSARLHVDMMDYCHTYETVTDQFGVESQRVLIESDRDPTTGISLGSGGVTHGATSSPSRYQRSYRGSAEPVEDFASRSGFALGPPSTGRAVTMPGRTRLPFTGSANVFHLGLYFLANQFLSGSELNYGTKDAPDYRYTENLRYTNEIYDIDNLTGQKYTDYTMFDTSGVIEPLDIRKEITGDHLCIGDFYDPIHNTLKGTVQSTDRVLTHLGITQKIGETYDIVKDTAATPFEYIDKAVDIYGLHLTVPKLQVQVPRTYILSFNEYFDTSPSSPDRELYDFMRSVDIGPLVLQRRTPTTRGSYNLRDLGRLRIMRPDDSGPADYSSGDLPTGDQWGRNNIAQAASEAINSSSMGIYVTASWGVQIDGTPGEQCEVFITPLTSSSDTSGAWNDQLLLWDPTTAEIAGPENLNTFNKWSLNKKSRSKSTGGGWCDYSPYLNLTDLTDNPDPFFEMESNTENLQPITRTTDKSIQYVLAASSSVSVWSIFQYDGAILADCTQDLAATQKIISRGKYFRPMHPFSSTEKSTPKGMVYDNAPFGYDSLSYGGYKK